MSFPLRTVARLVILDANGAVLLLRYEDDRPGRPASFWTAPGGALEPGETHRAAAARELREETGLACEIGPDLWECAFEFDHGDGAGLVRQVERYFLVRVDAAAPAVADSSGEDIREHRWWPLESLRATSNTLLPEDLADLLTARFAAPEARSR
jgi:ADP-ribose pyrophosphatase YjhB (NUDIX family)